MAARARLTVDLRNTHEDSLAAAERMLLHELEQIRQSESVEISDPLAGPLRARDFRSYGGVACGVQPPPSSACRFGASPRALVMDAQMLARVCPAAMVFVPSVGGISHNPAEHTAPDDLVNGANVLLHTLLDLTALTESTCDNQ